MLSVILSIFILILKILGILLLILLGLLLLLFLVPICYHMEIDAPEGGSFQAQARVSWFLWLLRGSCSYHQKKGLSYELKLCAKVLLGSDEDSKKKESSSKVEEDRPDSLESLPENTKTEEIRPKETKTEEIRPKETKTGEIRPEETKTEEIRPKETKTGETKTQEIRPKDKKSEIPESGQKKVPRAEPENEQKKVPRAENEHKKKEEKSGELKKEKERPGRFDSLLAGWEEKKSKVQSLYAKAEEYQLPVLLDIARKTLIRLLKHIFPRHVSGWIRYGFDDPSLTGRITAYLAMFYPLYGKSCMVEPDFSRSCFAGQFRCKGHVQLGYLLWLVIGLLLKKEIRKLIAMLFR